MVDELKVHKDQEAMRFVSVMPNEKSRAAIEELQAGGGKRFKSADALFHELGLRQKE